MDRLGMYVFLAAGIAVPGTLVIIVMALGIYDFWAIAGSAAIGLALSLPASQWAARRIKKEDPEWDARRERPKTAPPEERPEKI